MLLSDKRNNLCKSRIFSIYCTFTYVCKKHILEKMEERHVKMWTFSIAKNVYILNNLIDFFLCILLVKKLMHQFI